MAVVRPREEANGAAPGSREEDAREADDPSGGDASSQRRRARGGGAGWRQGGGGGGSRILAGGAVRGVTAGGGGVLVGEGADVSGWSGSRDYGRWGSRDCGLREVGRGDFFSSFQRVRKLGNI
nr:protein FAM98B-like [Aegilops tauschii subsp. strangulata]